MPSHLCLGRLLCTHASLHASHLSAKACSPTSSKLQQVAASYPARAPVLEQVVVHAGARHLLVNLNRLWVALQLRRKLRNLQTTGAAGVGAAVGGWWPAAGSAPAPPQTGQYTEHQVVGRDRSSGGSGRVSCLPHSAATHHEVALAGHCRCSSRWPALNTLNTQPTLFPPTLRLHLLASEVLFSVANRSAACS